MSSSDGHGYITFGWIATIIGLLLFGAIGTLYTSSENQSSYYKQRCAQIYPDSPFATAYLVPSLPQPESSQGNEELPDQPDWCDLAAQQKMAEDTAGMHLAAWAGVMSGLAGIWLLIWTLVETRRSVAVAREMGEAQSRAYVAIGRPKAGMRVHGTECDIIIAYRNTGASPARRPTLKINVQFSLGRTRISETAELSLAEIDAGRDYEETITIDLSKHGVTNKIIWAREMLLVLDGKIVFEDVFDNEQVALIETYAFVGTAQDHKQVREMRRYRKVTSSKFDIGDTLPEKQEGED